MFRLVESHMAAAGKRDSSDDSPSGLFHWGARHAFCGEHCDLRFEVVAHKVKFAGVLGGRMKGGFGWRQREDQPAMTCVDGLEAEDVTEEIAVGFGIPGVDYDVSA